MEGFYELKFGGQAVGKVQVTRQGLYYRFRCRCRLSGDVISRVSILCDGKQDNLGILVPMGDGFGLDTGLAVKKLGQGRPEFLVMPVRPKGEKFVPLRPEEPFSYLSRLKNAYLAERNGTIGILLDEK